MNASDYEFISGQITIIQQRGNGTIAGIGRNVVRLEFIGDNLWRINGTLHSVNGARLVKIIYNAAK